MTYTKIFKPDSLFQDFRDSKDLDKLDRRDGKVYLYNEEIILAINIALATGRPLLLKGASGSGKSSLAYNVARILNRRYYEYVITARTQAKDLLWRFDAVRRFGDTHFHSANPLDEKAPWQNYYPYIEPGVFWWVFDSESAKYRGQTSESNKNFLVESKKLAKDPVIFPVLGEQQAPASNTPSVILLDEIDKAEPDVPNNLLVPLGSLEFEVEELQLKVQFKEKLVAETEDNSGRNDQLPAYNLPLILITTNEERRLPEAFIRRCIPLRLDDPTINRLIQVAIAAEGSERTINMQEILDPALANDQFFEQSEDRRIVLYRSIASQMVQQQIDRPVSIAEYLDAVRACIHLDIDPDSDKFQNILTATILKE